MTRYLFSAENRMIFWMSPGSACGESFIPRPSVLVPGVGRCRGHGLRPGPRGRHRRDGGLEPRLGVDEEVRAPDDDVALLQALPDLHDAGTVIARRDLARRELSFSEIHEDDVSRTAFENRVVGA